MNKAVERRIKRIIRYCHLRERRDLRTHFRLATKKRHVVNCEETHLTARAVSPLKRLCDAETIRTAKRRIEELNSSDRHRELIRRRLIGGERISDLADELGFPHQSARRIVMRARRSLRQGDV